MMLYRALRNIALARDGRHVIVRSGEAVDPAWLSEAGLSRLISRGYVVAEESAPDIPVTAIRGIGGERAKALAAMGIETAAGLLAADPVEIERRMSSLTVRQIEDWQAQAQVLLEQAAVERGGDAVDVVETSQINSKKGCKRCGYKISGHRA